MCALRTDFFIIFIHTVHNSTFYEVLIIFLSLLAHERARRLHHILHFNALFLRYVYENV